MIRVVTLVVIWLLSFLKKKELLKVFTPLLLSLELILKTRGPLEYVKYNKTLRNAFLLRLSQNKKSKGIKFSKTWPKVLGPQLAEI
jgi:hypothetical protein